MKTKKEPAMVLRKRRTALMRQLPPLQAILRGSLIERYKRCGKPGCKCADGPGHGPKYYLSVSYPGLRPQMDYVCSKESWAGCRRRWTSSRWRCRHRRVEALPLSQPCWSSAHSGEGFPSLRIPTEKE